MDTPTKRPQEAPWLRWLRYGGIAAIVLAILTYVLAPEASALSILLLVAALGIWVVHLIDHLRRRRVVPRR